MRNLLAQGVDLYAVDWGNPDAHRPLADASTTTSTAISTSASSSSATRTASTRSTCSASARAACSPSATRRCIRSACKNLIVTITPIDFHADQAEGRADHGFINLWTRSLDAGGRRPPDRGQRQPARRAHELRVLDDDAAGRRSPSTTSACSTSIDDEKKLLNFLRMEKWLADRPHHPGEAAKQWLKDLYQDNKLVKNEFELGGRKVDLRRDHDARAQHLRRGRPHHPAADARARWARSSAPTDYSEIGLPGGHVGVFVSGKSQGVLGKGIVDWLRRMTARERPRPADGEDNARASTRSRCSARTASRASATPSGDRATRSARSSACTA